MCKRNLKATNNINEEGGVREMVNAIKCDGAAESKELYATLTLKYLLLLNCPCKSPCDLLLCSILWPVATVPTNVLVTKQALRDKS